MICDSCKDQQHRTCDDVGHARLYRSCDCQHVENKTAEPATGPVGE